MDVNTLKTREAQQSEVYSRYKEWLIQQGCVFPSLQFPVAFWEDGVIGVMAKTDIPPSKAIAFVPYTITINVGRAKLSQISYIFQKHPQVFDYHTLAIDNILWTFIVYERMKGSNSFWHLYFQTISQLYSMLDWEKQDLDQLQDAVLALDSRI